MSLRDQVCSHQVKIFTIVAGLSVGYGCRTTSGGGSSARFGSSSSSSPLSASGTPSPSTFTTPAPAPAPTPSPSLSPSPSTPSTGAVCSSSGRATLIQFAPNVPDDSQPGGTEMIPFTSCSGAPIVNPSYVGNWPASGFNIEGAINCNDPGNSAFQGSTVAPASSDAVLFFAAASFDAVRTALAGGPLGVTPFTMGTISSGSSIANLCQDQTAPSGVPFQGFTSTLRGVPQDAVIFLISSPTQSFGSSFNLPGIANDIASGSWYIQTLSSVSSTGALTQRYFLARTQNGGTTSYEILDSAPSTTINNLQTVYTNLQFSNLAFSPTVPTSTVGGYRNIAITRPATFGTTLNYANTLLLAMQTSTHANIDTTFGFAEAVQCYQANNTSAMGGPAFIENPLSGPNCFTPKQSLVTTGMAGLNRSSGVAPLNTTDTNWQTCANIPAINPTIAVTPPDLSNVENPYVPIDPTIGLCCVFSLDNSYLWWPDAACPSGATAAPQITDMVTCIQSVPLPTTVPLSTTVQ